MPRVSRLAEQNPPLPPQLHWAPTSQAAVSHSTGKAAITPGPRPRLYLHRRLAASLSAASTPCSPHTSNTSSALMQRTSTPCVQTARKPPHNTGSRPRILPRSTTAESGRKRGGCHGGRGTTGRTLPPRDRAASTRPRGSPGFSCPAQPQAQAAAAASSRTALRPHSAALWQPLLGHRPARPFPRRPPERGSGKQPAVPTRSRCPYPAPAYLLAPGAAAAAAMTGRPASRARARAWPPGTAPSCHGAGAAPWRRRRGEERPRGWAGPSRAVSGGGGLRPQSGGQGALPGGRARGVRGVRVWASRCGLQWAARFSESLRLERPLRSPSATISPPPPYH